MALTAGEIILAAREYSPLFLPRTIPDAAALRTLSRLERQFADAVVGENPDALAVWGEVFPLPGTWEDGIALPANLLVLGADIEFDAAVRTGRWYVEITSPMQAATQPHLYPSAYVMGGKLFLQDVRYWFGELHGWEDVESFRIRYVPAITPLAALTTSITLPDTAQSALVANLALWMADRVGVQLATLREAANASGAAWVMAMVNLGSTRSWLVERVE